jgi:hypothetical protein
VRRATLSAALVVGAGLSTAATAATWCLGLGSLGPVHTGMSVEDVLALADWPGMERHSPAGYCWYLHYRAGGSDFDLMVIGDAIARIELKGASHLHTFSGARLGSSETDLQRLYGDRLEKQPSYDSTGRVYTLRSTDGDYGLRFEVLRGKVTAIQSGPWEHLNHVEGCS